MNRYRSDGGEPELRDYGPAPFVVNIDRASNMNPNYRNALWSGDHLQLTLMTIPVGGDIGQEMHSDTDQFIRVERGYGLVQMGPNKDDFTVEEKVNGSDAFIIPAGTWHNLTNIGHIPLRLYSIYAPPKHPRGTVHPTKEIAEWEEG